MEATGIHLWLVLWKAYEAVRRHAVRHIRSLGLGFSDFAVLEVLLNKGPTPVNAIGERVHLTSGSITAAIDRLEQKSLVERCADASDRRSRVVHLTDAGRGLDRVRPAGSCGGDGGCHPRTDCGGAGRSGSAVEEVGPQRAG